MDEPVRGLGGVASAIVTAATMALLGAPVGLAWASITPAPLVLIASGGAQFANPEANTFFAADGYFLLIGLAAGVLCGLIALRLRDFHPLGVLVGLAGGGIAAAVVAARVGTRVHRAAFIAALTHARLGTHLSAFVVVRAEGAYFGWSFAAVLVYGIAAAIRAEP